MGIRLLKIGEGAVEKETIILMICLPVFWNWRALSLGLICFDERGLFQSSCERFQKKKRESFGNFIVRESEREKFEAAVIIFDGEIPALKQ